MSATIAEGAIRKSLTESGEYEVYQYGSWSKMTSISVIGMLTESKNSADELYAKLKAKVTGQVINGTLTGVLLESELKEVYEQLKQSDSDE